MLTAWVKASRLSRSLTSVNGGGKSMGFDANACVRGVGDSCRSSFLFRSNEHNYTRRTADASLLAAVPRLFSRSVGQGMARPPKTILMCSCEDTMRLDTAAVKRGCRNSEIATFHQLCRAELDQFRNAARAEGSLTVGCTQEAPLFSDEAGRPAGRSEFGNLREGSEEHTSELPSPS